MHDQQLYIDGLEAITEPSFLPIKQLATSRLRAKCLLADGLVEERLFASLARGTAVLETEDQVDAYMHAFGSKHYHKCMLLFEKLPKDVLAGHFDIIDWACGGGVSVVSAFDFLGKKKVPLSYVRQISLIEPSACALQRAKVNAEHLFPNSFVRTVHKRFEQLDECDFEGKVGVPRIHLFSNILDLNIFDDALFVDKFCKLLKTVSFRTDETFMCVSPAYRNCLSERFNKFLNRIVDQDRWISTLLCEIKSNEPSMYAIITRVQNQQLIGLHQNRAQFVDYGATIFDLAAANDACSVNAMITSGAQLDVTDADGWPLLVIAAKYGAVDVLKFLLGAGASVHQTNKEGASGLYFAAKYNQLDVAETLIQKKADLDVMTHKSRRTALFMAAKANHLEIATMLIEAGAQVDLQDSWGQTPLLCAVKGEYIEMIFLLLKGGADPQLVCRSGISPLVLARSCNNKQIIELLAEYE